MVLVRAGHVRAVAGLLATVFVASCAQKKTAALPAWREYPGTIRLHLELDVDDSLPEDFGSDRLQVDCEPVAAKSKPTAGALVETGERVSPLEVVRGAPPWSIDTSVHPTEGPGQYTVRVTLDNRYEATAPVVIHHDGRCRPNALRLVLRFKASLKLVLLPIQVSMPRGTRSPLGPLTLSGTTLGPELYAAEFVTEELNGKWPRTAVVEVRIPVGRHQLTLVDRGLDLAGKAAFVLKEDGLIDAKGQPVVPVTLAPIDAVAAEARLNKLLDDMEISLAPDREEIERLIATLERDPVGRDSYAAAQALGDLTLTESVARALPDDVRARVRKVAAAILPHTDAATGEARMAARHQLERLWRLAAPVLIENIGNKDTTIAEAAIKTLVLMRDGEIVTGIIDSVKNARDGRTKMLGCLALGKMMARRTTTVPDRVCLSGEASAELAREAILPFLQELSNAETSSRMKKRIDRSLEELTRALRTVPATE